MQLKLHGINYTSTLGPWIGKTFKMIDAYIDNVLQINDIDLTRKQWLVLNFVYANHGINQNELAKMVERDKTSITRFIANLEKKDFIKKIILPEDKRTNALFLTENGKALVEKATPIVNQAVLKLQQNLKSTEIEQTISVLKKIQNQIEISNLKK